MRISKVSLKSSSLKAHVAEQGTAIYHATSCKRLHIIPNGSSKSNGRRPHLGNTTPLASSSIRSEHRNDPDSSSKKHQGDLSWMPSVSVALLAPGMVLRRSLGLVPLERSGVDPDEAAARAELVTASAAVGVPAASSSASLLRSAWGLAFAATLCFSFLAMFSIAKGKLRSYNSSRNLCFPSKGTWSIPDHVRSCL